jgi:uncharacterized protein YpbB
MIRRLDVFFLKILLVCYLIIYKISLGENSRVYKNDIFLRARNIEPFINEIIERENFSKKVFSKTTQARNSFLSTAKRTYSSV